MRVLYQSDNYIAIDKPPGLLVHRTPMAAHETEHALQLVRRLVKRHVHPVHRLDRATSGVLLFALNKEALTHASHQFASQQVKKTYHAIVRGKPEASGVIEHPLKEDEKVKQATTVFKRIGFVEVLQQIDKYPSAWYSLVQLQPKTGRTHQLRRHLKHLGHPIIGDSKYGKSNHNAFFSKTFGRPRMYLTCCELQLELDGGLQKICTPRDPDFERVLSGFSQWEMSS